MSVPKSITHISRGRRVKSKAFQSGRSTSLLGLPFGLPLRISHSRANAPSISSGPFFDAPIKQTPMFSFCGNAVVKSTPSAPPAVKSALIRATGSPFNSRGVLVASAGGGLRGSPLTRPTVSLLPKQTSDTRTAAPSLTHGSSLQALKMRRSATMASSTLRLAPPRIELVATSPQRRPWPLAMCCLALWNQ